MKFRSFAAGLLSLAMVSPAAAQSVPDDLHCFQLSNIYAKAEKDDKRRMLAAQATMFYLGKIDGRVSPQAVRAVMGTRLNPQTAGLQMTACAQRLGHVEQALQQALTPAAPKH